MVSTPADPQPPTTDTKRPTGWIVATAVLALVAIGLAIWGITTKSDLDQANEQIGALNQEVQQADARDVQQQQQASQQLGPRRPSTTRSAASWATS
jgi:hypothetical protein